MRSLLMLVEDDDDIRETFADVLRECGYEVSEAQNGRHALELLGSGPRPALILLDAMMPVMDGRSFREAQLKNAAIASIPVVLMSAGNNAHELVADLSFQAILRKPLGLDALLAAIRAALASVLEPA